MRLNGRPWFIEAFALLQHLGVLASFSLTEEHRLISAMISSSLQTFTDGITNQLIGCYVGSVQEPSCVLVRLYGKMTELYVNRDQEVNMFQILHAHGCGPQIYCSFRNGICYEFTRGMVLEDELLRQPSIYRSNNLMFLYLSENVPQTNDTRYKILHFSSYSVHLNSNSVFHPLMIHWIKIINHSAIH